MKPPGDSERGIILGLVGRFRREGRDHTIERVARAVLDGATEINPADAQVLLREIHAPSAARWRQSAVAIWALGEIPVGPRTKASLTGPLCLFADREQPDNRTDAALDIHLKASVWTGLSTGFVAGTTLALYTWGQTWASLLERLAIGLVAAGLLSVVVTVLSAMMLWPLTTSIATLWFADRAALPRRYAIRTLGRWRRVEAAGPTAREIARGTLSHLEAVESLRAVVTALGPDDCGKVSERDQRSLATLIHDAYLPALPAEAVTEILAAFGHVGGGAVLQDVRVVADSLADPGARAEARRVLPLLEARARRERESASLVRPASQPDDSGTLVRPAASVSQDESVLVRPVDGAAESP